MEKDRPDRRSFRDRITNYRARTPQPPKARVMTLPKKIAVFEDEFIVEKILSKKIEDGRDFYFVKWLNWPEHTNTWEPIEHLSNCTKSLLDFERTNKGTKAEEAKSPTYKKSPKTLQLTPSPLKIRKRRRSPISPRLLPQPKKRTPAPRKPELKEPSAKPDTPPRQEPPPRQESPPRPEPSQERSITRVVNMVELNKKLFFLVAFDDDDHCYYVVEPNKVKESSPLAVIEYYEGVASFIREDSIPPEEPEVEGN